MNINISILTCLQLVAVHKKLTIQFLIQFIKDQASLRSNQRTVGICIALVPDVTDCLALCIYVVHHVDKIKFIITIITIALGNCRIHTLQSSFNDIMHLLDLNLIFSKRICMLLCKTTDKIFFFRRKFIKDSCGRFVYCFHDLLRIKFFSCSVFLNYINHTLSLLFAAFMRFCHCSFVHSGGSFTPIAFSPYIVLHMRV